VIETTQFHDDFPVQVARFHHGFRRLRQS
jgi:hypothetical protein